MHNWLKLALVLIIGALAGFYTCIIVNKYSHLEINPVIGIGINPFEIISILVTVILAVYVARIVSKANDLEKGEKDLIISSLKNFKDEFKSKIFYLLEQTDFDSIITNSSFKVIRKRIDSIVGLSLEHKFIEKDEPHSNDLIHKIRDVWELFTNTPKKASSRSNAAVKSDIERLRLEQVNKIEMTVIEIERLLFQLTMKINRK